MEDNNEKLIQQDEDIVDSENGLIFNPYNPINKEITNQGIQNILTKYGINHKITNFELYRRAFIHKSYTKRPYLDNLNSNITVVEKPYNSLPLSTKSNERLEFLGDGVLECITKYYSVETFT